MLEKKSQFALLIDLENFLGGLDSDNAVAAITEMITALQANVGNLVHRKAFADWSNNKLRKAAAELQRHGVIMQHLQRGQSKNLSHDMLAFEAISCLATKPGLDGFVIVTSEADYQTLLGCLKGAGKIVIAIANDSNVNSSWKKLCDEFLPMGSGKPSSKSAAAAPAAAPSPEKNAVVNVLKDLVPVNGLLLEDLEQKVKEALPDFTPEQFQCSSLMEFLQSVSNVFKLNQTEEGLLVIGPAGKNASPYSLQELQSFSFAEYMRVTRWYIEDANIRDRVLHNIYALFEDNGRVLTNEELHNLVDPDGIVEERPWYGTIFSLVYGACLWENPDDSSVPLPRRRLSLFRTVKNEEEFLVRYYTSLFHKAYTERPELTAQMCAELMHPEDVEAHLPLYERVLEELEKRH
ncbi:MAG: NYN domain-containing protein [Oligosphaeraceae bacterium]|nr:NYN domain-containing protein [Oligosphaeraceae bacterium]